MEKGGYVYIMANKPFGRLYIGVTANLPERVLAHKEGRGSFHCTRWNLHKLVYMEPYNTIEEANPKWDDLFDTING